MIAYFLDSNKRLGYLRPMILTIKSSSDDGLECQPPSFLFLFWNDFTYDISAFEISIFYFDAFHIFHFAYSFHFTCYISNADNFRYILFHANIACRSISLFLIDSHSEPNYKALDALCMPCLDSVLFYGKASLFSYLMVHGMIQQIRSLKNCSARYSPYLSFHDAFHNILQKYAYYYMNFR